MIILPYNVYIKDDIDFAAFAMVLSTAYNGLILSCTLHLTNINTELEV